MDATLWTVARQAPLPMDSPGKNIGVGSHSFLQGIFLTQESNLGLLYSPLSQQGSPLSIAISLTKNNLGFYLKERNYKYLE